MKNSVSVRVSRQAKENGKWVEKLVSYETWTIEKVKEYFSKENMIYWKKLSIQRVKETYTEHGKLPCKYWNTEKMFQKERIYMTFHYER